MEVTYQFLRPDDRRRLRTLLQYCFLLTEEQVLNWVDDGMPGEWLLAGYCNDALVAAAIVQPRELIGRRKGAVATIGGVATAPQARGRGHARGLMRFALHHLREQGVGWAVLYPFDFEFYHRMGWGQGAPMVGLSIRDPRLLGRDARCGGCRLVGVESWERLDEIHRAWASEGPGALRRHRREWERLLDRPVTPRHCALWETDSGGAYVVYEMRRPPGGARNDSVCTVHDWAWTSPQARDAVLAFLAHHAGQVARIFLKAPVEDPLTNLEGPCVERSFLRGPMVRLVDVERYLADAGAAAPIPLSVCLHDPLCPWNRGSHRRAPGGRGALTQDEGPEAETDVATLSSLLWGSMSLETAAKIGLVRGRDAAPLTPLYALAVGDPPFFLDWF